MIVDDFVLEFLHTIGLYQYPEAPVAYITAKSEKSKSVTLRAFTRSDVKKVDGIYQKNRDPNRNVSSRPTCEWKNTGPNEIAGSYSPPNHMLISCIFRKHWGRGIDNILLSIRMTRNNETENGVVLESLKAENSFGRLYRGFKSNNYRKDLKNAKITLSEFAVPASSRHNLKISMKFEVVENLIGSPGDFSYNYEFVGIIPPSHSNLK
jgi:hypothetical protein